LDAVVALLQPGQAAADAVAGGGEDQAVMIDRRRAVGGAVGGVGIAPQELAVLGGHPDHAAAEELDGLPLPTPVAGDDGGVPGAIPLGDLRLPNGLAVLLVQGEEGRLLAAGGADELVTIDQGGFAVAPAARRPAKVLDQVPPPFLLALGRFEAYQV